MKRIRLFTALLLCLVLTAAGSTALAASKNAAKAPTIKVTSLTRPMRGGFGGTLTVTPSVPGFLTLKLLDENDNELRTLLDNAEVHSKANEIPFDGCDADGNPLPEGTYKLSASMINQYGVATKKDATGTIKLGSPIPTLEHMEIASSKPFEITVTFDAQFDDKMATANAVVDRVNPRPGFFGTFEAVEFKKPGSGKFSYSLKNNTTLSTAAGYYTIEATLYEEVASLTSKPVILDIVVTEEGDVYMLEDAPEDVIAAVDAIVETINAEKVSSALKKTTGSKSVGDVVASDEEDAEEEADEEEDSSKSDGEEEDSSSKTTTAKKAAVKTESDEVSYTAGEGVMGDEGLLIGAGVSDTASQTNAGYWTLKSTATDEEIWAALTRQMISANVAENESAYIYDSTEEGRKRLGTVNGLSQGLNVVKEREDGWSLVEAFRNEDGAFIRGYIRTNKLRVVEPNDKYGIVIDKAAQKLTVWSDGKAIGSCAVSTGLPTPKYLHRETPAGEYILVTRRGTIEYYGNGFSDNTIRLSGNYHLCEIPTTKKNGSDFSLLEDQLGEKATRGHIVVAHEASSDGGINADWIWDMTTDHKKVKVLIFDDKARDQIPE